MPSLLSDITSRLGSVSDIPALDASVLLAHITDKPRTWVLAHTELTLTPDQQTALDDSITRLQCGEPLPYVLGKWEFFGMEFEVTPDVLIPRPETERLVEKAISWLRQNPTRRNIVDVGTGSGAIAIALAANFSDAKILATDISPEALKVAKRNVEKHSAANRIDFINCDLLPDLKASEAIVDIRPLRFDLICANLPYIPTDTLHNLPIFNREPTLALDGGKGGLDQIQRLMKSAPEYLAPNAMMLLEIEATLGRQAIELAEQHFPEADVQLHQDLAGCDRLLEIQT